MAVLAVSVSATLQLVTSKRVKVQATKPSAGIVTPGSRAREVVTTGPELSEEELLSEDRP